MIATMDNRSSFQFPFFKLLLLLLFGLGVLLISVEISHAVERHGEETLSIRQCFDNGQAKWKWQEKGTEIHCLRQGPAEFWFRIIVNGKELTIYKKGSIRSVSDLLDFVRSKGGKWIK